MIKTPNSKAYLVIGLATFVSWAGEAIHNAVELPALSLASPENGVPPGIAKTIFLVYWLPPFKGGLAFTLLGGAFSI
jgi:hypothetical protein